MPNGGGVPEYFYGGAAPAGVPRLGEAVGLTTKQADLLRLSAKSRAKGFPTAGAPEVLQAGLPLLAIPFLLKLLGVGGAGLAAGTILGNLFGGEPEPQVGGTMAPGPGPVPGAKDAGAFWPWETPAGEGFLAPWTPQAQLPFGQGVGQIGKGYPSAGIAGSWSTNPANPEAGWIFFRLVNGKIGTFTRKGIWKEWRPTKHIVVSRNPRMATLIAATKKIDKLNSRLGKIFRKRTGRKVTIEPASRYLSPVERKALKA